MKLKVKVTQEHILDGKPGDDSSCAIALAMQEAARKRGLKVNGASIIPDHARLFGTTDTALYDANLPLIAQEFIEAYDDDVNLAKPIEFEVELKELRGYVTVGA